MGVSLAASRKRDAHTGHSAHSASLPQYPAQSNRAGYPLVWKGGVRLDDTAYPMAFSESEQSENEAGEMVPLYAARVQDLGLMTWPCSGAAHAGTRRNFRRARCYAGLSCSPRSRALGGSSAVWPHAPYLNTATSSGPRSCTRAA